MVSDVTRQLDAENMIGFITFALALSQAERDNFFQLPERKPFQAKLVLSRDADERRQVFLTIGTYLTLKYKEIRERKGEHSEETKSAAENLRMFYEYSSYNLFAELDYNFSDKINGLVGRDKKATVGDEIAEFFQKYTCAGIF